jgi:hypothetical protein
VAEAAALVVVAAEAGNYRFGDSPAIVVRRRWQLLLLPLLKASESPMRPVVTETTTNISVKYLDRRGWVIVKKSVDSVAGYVCTVCTTI